MKPKKNIKKQPITTQTTMFCQSRGLVVVGVEVGVETGVWIDVEVEVVLFMARQVLCRCAE